MPKGTKPEPGPLTKAVADRLRAQMGIKKINTVALAGWTGISRPMISTAVNGKRQMDIDELDVICLYLGLVLHEVIRDAEDQTRSRHAEH